MRSTKAEYIKEQLNYNRDNPKKFWNLINTEIIPDDKGKVFNFKNEENDTLYGQNQLPNLINDYCSGIRPLLASKIPQRLNVKQIAGVANHEGFELGEFHYEELLKCVKEISIYKSSGIINLSTRFFKDTMLSIPNVFLHLYNIVRDTSIFPNDWKIATVVLLPKCNNPSNPSELRPVSLLPIVGKIKEKHGVRKDFSTTSATAKFLDEIAMGLDNENYTIAVFLDIKKAFDTIDHRIIIEKLKHAGIGPRTLSLFSNYLKGRKQGVLYMD